ncbi:MAG TPA: DUF2799 domain-containing protein [Gammaproteobacteria bacterium]|nr:DUF2799 domain-containing protein [Gammaproteobacteria bacterium]
MSAKRVVVLGAAVFVLAGCSGMSEQACLTADWRTVGFEDGTMGRSVANIGSYRNACADHGVAPDLEAYRAGHGEGVEIYCRESNGFAVGHSGAAYQGVCPAHLEAAFVSEYNAGRRLHELESALRNVDARIAGNYRAQENIKEELTAIAARMIATDTTPEQRVAMVTRSADLGRRYGELTTEIRELERDRALAERALLDYEQTLAASL